MLAIIDFDCLVYRAAFAAQKTVRYVTMDDQQHSFDSAEELKEWASFEGEDVKDLEVTVSIKPVPDAVAKSILSHLYKEVTDYLQPNQIRLFIESKSSSDVRRALYPEYKSNRSIKPYHLENLMSFAKDRLGAEVCEGHESDDAVTMVAYDARSKGIPYVIVAQDKDLDTVAGAHYNPIKKEWYVVDDHEASFNFYVQLLMGDSADNIPGLYGIGKIKASKLLEDCANELEMWEVTQDKYNEAGVAIEECLRNARLLHMQRYPGDLWMPPTMDTGEET